MPRARPQPFNDRAWLFEPSTTGSAELLYLTRHRCTFYSKRGNAMTRFRDLAEQLRAELGRHEVILDGEIVAICRRPIQQVFSQGVSAAQSSAATAGSSSVLKTP